MDRVLRRSNSTRTTRPGLQATSASAVTCRRLSKPSPTSTSAATRSSSFRRKRRRPSRSRIPALAVIPTSPCSGQRTRSRHGRSSHHGELHDNPPGRAEQQSFDLFPQRIRARLRYSAAAALKGNEMNRQIRFAMSAIAICISLGVTGCNRSSERRVTVYVSEDRVFSEPILKDFERDTGIKVNAVFDTEEAKSTGVMNRLVAEKGNPQADVYLANEPVRADVLREQEISTPYVPAAANEIPRQFKDSRGYWTGFSARARLL